MPSRTASRPGAIAGHSRGDHLRSGETRRAEDSVQGDRGQDRQEQEQPAELGGERPWVQVELPDIGDLGRCRVRAGRAFVVGPARQASEPFILEDPSHRDRAERMPLVSQVPADVIDGEILLSQGDDEFAEGIGLGCGLGSLGRGQEEGAAGVLAELMDQDAKAAGGVTEAAGDFGTGEWSTKKARRASYWRWVELAGSRKSRQRSVSSLGSLVNIVPQCQIEAVSSRPRQRIRRNDGKMGGDARISRVRWRD